MINSVVFLKEDIFICKHTDAAIELDDGVPVNDALRPGNV